VRLIDFNKITLACLRRWKKYC